ncbi:hypothetical protein [Thiomicrorhabdus cannonii]|uniref:hypothetical protein n=1 Tax=Thiomicrorhabdus cannonii TaxID=2748011 RepID=UPI0015B96FD1|nr:hypothetical protein [Thiomicrorhabdus cannonii]
MTYATICNAMHLQAPNKPANIVCTTKTPAARCAAVNSAFFMPKICAFLCAMGMEDRNRIYQNAGGLIAPNTRPFNGNMGSRLVSVVETRPPETKTGGQTLTKTPGGHTMPNTSFGLHTVGDYSLTVSLPSNSFIREFMASFNGCHWIVSVITTKDQISTIKQRDGGLLAFDTLDSVARFLADQGAPDMSVSLLGLIGGRA